MRGWRAAAASARQWHYRHSAAAALDDARPLGPVDWVGRGADAKERACARHAVVSGREQQRRVWHPCRGELATRTLLQAHQAAYATHVSTLTAQRAENSPTCALFYASVIVLLRAHPLPCAPNSAPPGPTTVLAGQARLSGGPFSSTSACNTKPVLTLLSSPQDKDGYDSGLSPDHHVPGTMLLANLDDLLSTGKLSTGKRQQCIQYGDEEESSVRVGS